MIDRMDRVQEMLRREISTILQNDIDDPRIEHVTITELEVSRDLRNAKVLFTLPPDMGLNVKNNAAKGLKAAAKFIRKELAERITIKYIPRLVFVEDKKSEREESIDRIFERIEEEHRGNEAADEEKGVDNG